MTPRSFSISAHSQPSILDLRLPCILTTQRNLDCLLCPFISVQPLLIHLIPQIPKQRFFSLLTIAKTSFFPNTALSSPTGEPDDPLLLQHDTLTTTTATTNGIPNPGSHRQKQKSFANPRQRVRASLPERQSKTFALGDPRAPAPRPATLRVSEGYGHRPATRPAPPHAVIEPGLCIPQIACHRSDPHSSHSSTLLFAHLFVFFNILCSFYPIFFGVGRLFRHWSHCTTQVATTYTDKGPEIATGARKRSRVIAMTRSRQNRSSRLINLALFASVTSLTSAQAIALTRLDLITNVFITPQCLDAYTTPLPDCQLRDFLPGLRCSQSCIRNLRQLEPIIQQACSTARPKPSTLLDRIQDGDLVAAVCGAPEEDDDDDDEDRTTADGQTMTTITMTTRLDSDLPMMTTTVTKAITPKPSPTLTTTRVQSRPLPPSETEESSTEEIETTRARPIDPPRSSETESSEEPETTTEPATTRAPLRPSETTSIEPPSTTSANDVGDQGDDDDGEDDGQDDGNGNNGRLPGSGGGSLADIGFEGSSATISPRHLAAVIAALGAVVTVL